MRAMRKTVSSAASVIAAAALLFVILAAVWGYLIGAMFTVFLLAAWCIKAYISRPSA